MSKENLSLWSQVEKTPSEQTSKAKKGGFSFTSANAQYLIKRATELWGACGEGWEVHHKGQIVEASETEKVWVEEVTIKYPGPASGEMCSVTQYGVAKFCYMTNGANGYFKVDEEAPKKAYTNGISKTLSLLGFSADLWFGLYDNPSYIQSVDRMFEKKRLSEDFENKIDRLKKFLTQTGAINTKDEEMLCRLWSNGEVGSEDAYNDEAALDKVLQGQTRITKGSSDSEGIPLFKQMEAAREFAKGNK